MTGPVDGSLSILLQEHFQCNRALSVVDMYNNVKIDRYISKETQEDFRHAR